MDCRSARLIIEEISAMTLLAITCAATTLSTPGRLPVHSEDEFIRLIDYIYDAALAPERWPEFLEALAVATDGHSVNIAFGKPPFTEGALSLTSRFDPLAQRLYREL